MWVTLFDLLMRLHLFNKTDPTDVFLMCVNINQLLPDYCKLNECVTRKNNRKEIISVLIICFKIVKKIMKIVDRIKRRE